MHPISDYHIHTYLCGHADGKPEEYVQKAIDLGLEEVGFSDHAPLVSHRDPTITMDFDELPIYQKMLEDVREKFKEKIKVKIGIEADYIPGYEQKTKEILNSYPYDFVIGSVHFIKNWAFDNPREKKGWQEANTDFIYRQYYECLRESAKSGMFDIMAHVDLVKKFGHRPTSDMADEIEKTAKVFKETGVVIEINTSGLRKPVEEIYPSLSALSIYCKFGIPVTFGSDAHRASEVGMDFDKALYLVKAAGYQEYVLFEKRKISKKLPLL